MRSSTRLPAARCLRGLAQQQAAAPIFMGVCKAAAHGTSHTKVAVLKSAAWCCAQSADRDSYMCLSCPCVQSRRRRARCMGRTSKMWTTHKRPRRLLLTATTMSKGPNQLLRRKVSSALRGLGACSHFGLSCRQAGAMCRLSYVVPELKWWCNM